MRALSLPTRLVDADFSDLDQMCSTVQSWELHFRPLSRSLNLDCVGRIIQSRCGPVDLGYARFLTTLDQFGAPPLGKWTFGLPETRLKHLWWRGQHVRNDEIIVFPRGGELRSVSGADFEIYTISIDEGAVANACEAFKLPLPEEPLRTEVFRPRLQDLTNLRQQLRILRDRPDAISALGIQQIAETLVLSWLHQSDQPKRRPSLRARERAITRCLERMEDNDWIGLTPAVLCETANISERTLQYAFRERFGISPAAFLKARRLAAVRRALQTADSSQTSVGDLASVYGFWHAGQFATDYRRMFGENPSDSLRN